MLFLKQTLSGQRKRLKKSECCTVAAFQSHTHCFPTEAGISTLIPEIYQMCVRSSQAALHCVSSLSGSSHQMCSECNVVPERRPARSSGNQRIFKRHNCKPTKTTVRNQRSRIRIVPLICYLCIFQTFLCISN